LLSEFWEVSGNEKSTIIETIKNIKTIKLFVFEKNTIDKFRAQTYQKASVDKKIHRLDIAATSMEQAITHFDTLLIVYIGSNMILANTFSVGMLYSFIFYKNIFSRSFASLINDIVEVKTLKSEFQYLQDIFNEKEEKYLIKDNLFTKEKDKCDFFKQEIKFENFNFSYNELSPMIFKNFNFTIRKNESLCIIGESGSGKTTLLNSLVGLQKINKGEIFIGTQDIVNIPVNELRKNISYMLADDSFLDKNIIANISFH